MEIIIYIFVFLIGASAGSFAGVLIYRLPKGQDVVKKRSFCPNCQKKLGFWELIPIFSYLWLRGRCRDCQEKIPLRDFLVEIFTGILFLLFYVLEPQLLLIYWALVVCLVAIFFIDIERKIIPNSLVLFILGIGASKVVLSFKFFVEQNKGELYNSLRELYPMFNFLEIGGDFWINSLVGVFAMGVPLGLIYLLTSGQGMGFGDVKLGSVLGLVLGGIDGLLALILGFIIGGVVAMILVLLKDKKLKSEIPFGPFLCIGTILILLI